MDAAESGRIDALAVLRQLVYAAEELGRAIGTHLALSGHETIALVLLADSGGIDQTELSRRLGITSSSVTALIDRMEEHGLAERVSDPADRRRWLVRLTDHGQAARLEMLAAGVRVFDQVDDQALPVVLDAMRTVTDALTREARTLDPTGTHPDGRAATPRTRR